MNCKHDSSLGRDRYFDITARLGRINRVDDKLNMRTQLRPLGVADDDNRNLAVREILLIANVLVSGK
jgi:hypothetical protein